LQHEIQHSGLGIDVLDFEFAVSGNFCEGAIAAVFENRLGLQTVNFDFVDPVVDLLVRHLHFLPLGFEHNLPCDDSFVVRWWV